MNDSKDGLKVNWAKSERTFRRLDAESLGERMVESWCGRSRHLVCPVPPIFWRQWSRRSKKGAKCPNEDPSPIQQVFGGERRAVRLLSSSAPLCQRTEQLPDEGRGGGRGGVNACLSQRNWFPNVTVEIHVFIWRLKAFDHQYFIRSK